MSEQLPWVKRRFGFDLPADLYPELIERLRGTPARLEELVSAVPKTLLTVRPGGAWSIQEHVGHLMELESLFTGRLDDYAAGADELRPADMSNRATEEADYNSRDVEELLSEFRACREALVARLEALSPESFSRSAFHRRLGVQMRLADMCFFHAEHDDHHLARMRAISRSPG